jgi:hypothetical protein
MVAPATSFKQQLAIGSQHGDPSVHAHDITTKLLHWDCLSLQLRQRHYVPQPAAIAICLRGSFVILAIATLV